MRVGREDSLDLLLQMARTAGTATAARVQGLMLTIVRYRAGLICYEIWPGSANLLSEEEATGGVVVVKVGQKENDYTTLCQPEARTYRRGITFDERRGDDEYCTYKAASSYCRLVDHHHHSMAADPSIDQPMSCKLQGLLRL